MRFWILQTGEPLHIDDPNLRPMRGMNLSNELVSRGHQVLFISSDFNHYEKKHRNQFGKNLQINQNLRLLLIKSRGYKKHIGISRLFDHFQLSFNLMKILKNEVPPQVAFVGFPPIETAWILSKWLRKRNIPYFVDAKDAWPDIFLNYFPQFIRKYMKFLMLPYFTMTRNVFRHAKGIVAPTQDYLNWALDKAKRAERPTDKVAPLSAPEPLISEEELTVAYKFWENLGIANKHQLRVYFVGSLTDSYNFEPMVDLASQYKIIVIIAGEGPQKSKLKQIAETLENLIIPGWINQAQYVALAKMCDFSIIPLNNKYHLKSTFSNKYVDAIRLGIPILTSDKVSANSFLIPENVGTSFTSSEDLYLTMTNLKSNSSKYREMKMNSRRLYLEKFEYSEVYRSLVELLEEHQ